MVKFWYDNWTTEFEHFIGNGKYNIDTVECLNKLDITEIPQDNMLQPEDNKTSIIGDRLLLTSLVSDNKYFEHVKWVSDKSDIDSDDVFYYPIYESIKRRGNIYQSAFHFDEEVLGFTLKHTDPFIIDSIKNGKCKILIISLFEAYRGFSYDSNRMINSLYTAMPWLKASDIIVVSGESGKQVNIFTNHYGCEYTSVSYPYFMDVIKITASKYLSQNNPNLDNTSRPYKFLFYGGKPRLHRIVTMASLIDNDDISKGLIAMNSIASDNANTHTKRTRLINAFVSEMILCGYDEQSAVLLIDKTMDMINDGLTISRSPNNNYEWVYDSIDFINTYFSIIGETYPSSFVDGTEEDIFLTGKTFKCFAFKHPFVMVGQPKTLKRIRELGFKTFSPYIDESYDDIEDYFERMKAANKEIHRLCQMSNYELKEMREGLLNILEHNYNHMINSNDDLQYVKFLKRLPNLV